MADMSDGREWARRIWGQREPRSEMVWALCPYMQGRQHRDCDHCPEWENDPDHGKVQRGCYFMSSEGCRVVFAMLAEEDKAASLPETPEA